MSHEVIGPQVQVELDRDSPTAAELKDWRTKVAGVDTRARKTLGKLLQPDGIKASENLGAVGMYYADFNRDGSRMTEDIIDSVEDGADDDGLLDKAREGFVAMGQWTGTVDDPDTGQEIGLPIHEHRKENHGHLVEERENNGEKPWYFDQKVAAVLNWDGADNAALRVRTYARLEKHFPGIVAENINEIRSELEWILRDIARNGGRPGYMYDKERLYDGLRHKGWKDSKEAIKFPNGAEPLDPTTPASLMSVTWSALRYGDAIFRDKDPHFAWHLRNTAADLKRLFNSPQGFLIRDRVTGLYFAEAIAANGILTETSIDPAFGLADSYMDDYEVDSIIATEYRDLVVERIMQPDMLDPKAGVQNYTSDIQAADEESGFYHRGPHTVWIFPNGQIVKGMDKFGYRKEADPVANAVIYQLDTKGNNIELVIGDGNGNHRPYIDPKSLQESSVEQGFSASAALYIANRQLARSK